MSAYRTIQVTPKEYELLLMLHGYLIKLGTRSIEEKLGKDFSVAKTLKQMERSSLAKGAVAGLAIALSLHLLRKEKP